MINFRLLKNKMKEQDISTTESNALNDGGNQCNNIEGKDESTAVITSLVVIIVTIVIGLFVVVVYKKMRRRIKGTPGRRRKKDTLGRRRNIPGK